MLPGPAAKRPRSEGDAVSGPLLAAQGSCSTATSERDDAVQASTGVFTAHGNRFFIIPAKFSPQEQAQLERDIERGGGRVTGHLHTASIILTRLTARRRLARHLTKDDRIEWESKPILKEGFVKACLDLGVLQDFGPWQVGAVNEVLKETQDASGPPGVSVSADPIMKQPDLPKDVDNLPITIVPPERYRNSKYACQRWCPLYCVNEVLVRELAVIRTQRELEGEPLHHLAYSRAIAGIKSLPRKIRSVHDVESVELVGPKVKGLVAEFLKAGKLEEAERYRADPRYNVLRMLVRTIHGVGPAKARELYNVHNVRSIDDLRRLNLAGTTQIGLRYWEDLQLKLPRVEVEKIVKTVMSHVESILPGCLHTICGGYRRGKSFSNDVDIIITHPDPDMQRHRGLLARLVNRLKDRDLVTDVVYYVQPESDTDIPVPTGAHRHTSGVDRLDKAFVVFKQPASPPNRLQPIHRRVDIIVCSPHQYGAAIVGWTGSTMFERDIRRYATAKKGIKFDSGGMVTVGTEVEISAWTEEEVFEKLGLDFIPPEMRNADVAG